jgi:hypothetical protein
MKKLKETAQDNASDISLDTGINIVQHPPSTAIWLAERLFSGDGWTAAVTLDDAFAPELLQTWSLQDESAKDAKGAETNATIVDPDDAPLTC